MLYFCCHIWYVKSSQFLDHLRSFYLVTFRESCGLDPFSLSFQPIRLPDSGDDWRRDLLRGSVDLSAARVTSGGQNLLGQPDQLTHRPSQILPAEGRVWSEFMYIEKRK